MDQPIVYTEFVGCIERYLQAVQKSIVLVSPYLSERAAQFIVDRLPEDSTAIKKTVYTLPPSWEYITGASDFEALLVFKKSGFDVRSIERLHTKLFVFDDVALVGSANMTNRGWNINHATPNVELLVSLPTTAMSAVLKVYRDKSKALYIDEDDLAKKRAIYAELAERYEALKADALEVLPHSPGIYQQFLLELKEKGRIREFKHLTTDHGQNVYLIDQRTKIKIAYSSERLVDDPYSFTITKSARDRLQTGQVHALVLIFPDLTDFVWLPRKAALQTVLVESHRKKYNVWQFRLICKGESAVVKSKPRARGGREQVFDVIYYRNGVRKICKKGSIPRNLPFSM